jgi:hypothetical protein
MHRFWYLHQPYGRGLCSLLSSTGAEFNGFSDINAVSAEGRFVAFRSYPGNPKRFTRQRNYRPIHSVAGWPLGFLKPRPLKYSVRPVFDGVT